MLHYYSILGCKSSLLRSDSYSCSTIIDFHSLERNFRDHFQRQSHIDGGEVDELECWNHGIINREKPSKPLDDIKDEVVFKILHGKFADEYEATVITLLYH